MVEITSKDNKIIKLASNLINNKKTRDENDMFVVEGIKTVNEISDEFCIKNVIISRAFYEKIDTITCVKNKKALESILCIAENPVFKGISTMSNPEGIMAIVCKKKTNVEEILANDSIRKIVLLDDIQDPGNLGTIIRTADAMGIGSIITTNNTVDIYNAKVIRSTMGSMFHLPIIDKMDLESVLGLIKANRYKIYTTSLKSDKYISDINLKEEKICVVIGNEAHGVSDKSIESADEVFKIKMLGNAESLNASIAASIVMYELTKE